MIEFSLYHKNFNVSRDLSFLARISNAPLVISIIFIGTLFMVPPIITIPAAFGVLLLTADYLRSFYPDWPKEKYFIGKIQFDKDQLRICPGDFRTVPLQSIQEMVLFIDHFKGFQASSRDTSRNGNSMIFIKETNGNTATFKFNVGNEGEFHYFMKIAEKYKRDVSYFREYKPYEIPHILKPDYSDRMIYN